MGDVGDKREPEGIDETILDALLDAFEGSDWEEMAVSIGGDTLQVSRGGSLPPTPAADHSPDAAPAADPPVTREAAPSAPPGEVSSPAVPAGGVPVASPTVGLFWRAPAPGSPPFVEVGSRVEEGDTVGIVEVMKLMNHVSADRAGTVTEILVGNGDPVEFGQPLIRIEPNPS
jgi:acetyl-CoA carboxylase biotin carboxyl carrier protein